MQNMPDDILDSNSNIPVRKLHYNIIEILIIILSLIAWGEWIRAYCWDSYRTLLIPFSFGLMIYGPSISYVVKLRRISISYDKNNNLELIKKIWKNGDNDNRTYFWFCTFIQLIMVVMFPLFSREIDDAMRIYLSYTFLMVIINSIYLFYTGKLIKKHLELA